MSLFKTMNALDTLGMRDDYLADREAREMAKLNLSLIKANRLEARQLKADKRAERADERSARAEERSIISRDEAREAHEWRQDAQRKQDILDIFTPYQNALASENLTLEGLEGVGGEKSIEEGDSDEVKDKKRGWQGTFNIELANALEKYKDDPEALKQVKLVGKNVQQAYDITHKFEKDEEQLLQTIEELDNSHKKGSTANAASVRKLLTNIQNKHRLYIESSGVNKPLETAWENVKKEAETQSYVYNTLEQYKNASFDGKKINMLTENIDIFQDMVLPDDATEEQKIELRESRNFRDDNPRQYNKLKSAEYNASIGNFPEAERLLKSLHGDFVGDIGIEGRKASAEAKTIKALLEDAKDENRKQIISRTGALQSTVSIANQNKGKDSKLHEYTSVLTEFSNRMKNMDTKVNYDSKIFHQEASEAFRSIVNKVISEESGGEFLSLGVEVFEETGKFQDYLQNDLEGAALLFTGQIYLDKVKDEKSGETSPVLRWNVFGEGAGGMEKDEAGLIYMQWNPEKQKVEKVHGIEDMAFKIDPSEMLNTREKLQYADTSWLFSSDNLELKNAMANAAEIYLRSTPEFQKRRTIIEEDSRADSPEATKRLLELSASNDIKKQIASATEDGVFDVTERQDLVESFEKINESDATKVLKLLEEEGLLNAENRKKFQETWNDWAGKSDKERQSMMDASRKQAEKENQITILDKSSERREFRRKYGNKMTPAERNKFSKDGIIPTRFIDIYNKER